MEIVSKKSQTVKDCLIEYNFSKKVIRSLKYVYVNDKEVRLWQTVNAGDILVVPIKEEESDVIATKGEIDIKYEDEYILIVCIHVHLVIPGADFQLHPDPGLHQGDLQERYDGKAVPADHPGAAGDRHLYLLCDGSGDGGSPERDGDREERTAGELCPEPAGGMEGGLCPERRVPPDPGFLGHQHVHRRDPGTVRAPGAFLRG